MKQPAVLRRLSAVPRSDLHDRRLAALVGSALGVAFALCFATGLLSHLIQEPPGWFDWTSRPAGLYRITQGLHVVTGFVSIPLLLAKLWIVVPKLIEWPPARSVAQAESAGQMLDEIIPTIRQTSGLVQEIAQATSAWPGLRLVLGHPAGRADGTARGGGRRPTYTLPTDSRKDLARRVLALVGEPDDEEGGADSHRRQPTDQGEQHGSMLTTNGPGGRRVPPIPSFAGRISPETAQPVV